VGLFEGQVKVRRPVVILPFTDIVKDTVVMLMTLAEYSLQSIHRFASVSKVTPLHAAIPPVSETVPGSLIHTSDSGK